jgi:hypothetical protein
LNAIKVANALFNVLNTDLHEWFARSSPSDGGDKDEAIQRFILESCQLLCTVIANEEQQGYDALNSLFGALEGFTHTGKMGKLPVPYQNFLRNLVQSKEKQFLPPFTEASLATGDPLVRVSMSVETKEDPLCLVFHYSRYLDMMRACVVEDMNPGDEDVFTNLLQQLLQEFEPLFNAFDVLLKPVEVTRMLLSTLLSLNFALECYFSRRTYFY